MSTLTSFQVGDARITKLPELSLEAFDLAALFPTADHNALAADAGRWGIENYRSDKGLVRQSIHSWLVQTPAFTVLIDTATGNDKQRPTAPIFHQLDQPFIEGLRAAGATPESVDWVLLTHIHADHVGWNTTFRAGQWEPTFPNARYVFSRREYAYNHALTHDRGAVGSILDQAGLGDPHHEPISGVFEDSVQPIIAAGLAQQIDVTDTDIAGFRFHSSPGHSIDHAAISLTSRGETALFWGDVLHHPVQVHHPDANSVFCEFHDAARESRHYALRQADELDALVFTTHFADSSVGRVTRRPQGYEWEFVQGIEK